MPKGKKNKDPYFGPKEEQAIKDYLKAETIEEKNKIYTEKLHKPIEKLVYAIIRTYPKHIGSCGIEELEARAYVHVYNSIHGFNPNIIGKNGQPAKAYSYLGTICNNYYKTHSRESYRVESHTEDIGQYNTDSIEEKIKEHINPDAINEEIFLEKLFRHVIISIEKEIETNKRLKVNEIKVGEAIIHIFKNYKDFFTEEDQNIEFTKKGKIKKQKYTNIYKKNKIFYILREITALDSKELRACIVVFKELYKLLKNDVLENS